jgi:hypothetical protein
MKHLTRAVLLVVISLALAAPTLQAADTYAAIAYSPSTGKWGYGHGYPTKEEAIARATRECDKDDVKTNWCKNAWLALALSNKSRGGWGSAWGETRALARSKAKAECLKHNPDAYMAVSIPSAR